MIYSIDCSASPLEIAAQALIVLQVQEYARRSSLAVEEGHRQQHRKYLLVIPLDELNAVLDDLSVAGLLLPLQEISGRPAAHTVLQERFSTLTWIDSVE